MEHWFRVLHALHKHQVGGLIRSGINEPESLRLQVCVLHQPHQSKHARCGVNQRDFTASFQRTVRRFQISLQSVFFLMSGNGTFIHRIKKHASRLSIGRIADNRVQRILLQKQTRVSRVPRKDAYPLLQPVQNHGPCRGLSQVLLYLYGFPEIDSDEEGLQLDSETINTIIVCMGIMNGVAGANNAIKAMAKALAAGVEKQLLKTALTKGTVYPIVKQVMKWFGVSLTKSLFAGAVRKAIPVVGGVVGGGLTFAAFKPCCNRLKDALKDTMLSNPEHVSSAEEESLFTGIMSGEVIDASFEEIPEDEEPQQIQNGGNDSD